LNDVKKAAADRAAHPSSTPAGSGFESDRKREGCAHNAAGCSGQQPDQKDRSSQRDRRYSPKAACGFILPCEHG